MHYEGPVEVPKDLAPGPIKIRARYESETGPNVLPAEYELPQEPKPK